MHNCVGILQIRSHITLLPTNKHAIEIKWHTEKTKISIYIHDDKILPQSNCTGKIKVNRVALAISELLYVCLK